MFSCTHMAEAAPHHLELIYQLLVQGTHFWVYQLLVHGQTDSQDVDLWGNVKALDEAFIVWRKISPELVCFCCVCS